MWSKRNRTLLSYALVGTFCLSSLATTWMALSGKPLLYSVICAGAAVAALLAAVKVSPPRGIPAHVPIDDPAKREPHR